MISFNNITKVYRNVTVLDIPDLTLNEGELIGLVGNNGAGKTTMMRLMLDLIKANSGFITVDGKRVNEDESWKTFTGSYLDSTFLIDYYTAEEFFGFIAEVYGISKEELNARLICYEALMNEEILGKKKYIHDFSNGNRQKIGIIGAMLVNPRVLILDEPFNYLDPSSQIVVAHLIRQMNRELGTTVLVSSHNLASINDLCKRIILLDKGRVLIDKSHTPGEKDPELEEYFFSAAG